MAWGTSPVQKTFAQVHNSAPALNFVSNVTAGNLLVCYAAFFQSGLTGMSASDNQGNTWQQAVFSSSLNNTRAALFWAIANAGGVRPLVTVTPSPSGTPFAAVALEEWLPDTGTVVVDGTGSNAVNSTTPSAGSPTVTGNDLILCFFGQSNSNNTSIAAGTGFTLSQSSTSVADMAFGSEYAANKTSTLAGTFTIAPTEPCAIVVASFKTSGGGPTAQVWPYLDMDLGGGFQQLSMGVNRVNRLPAWSNFDHLARQDSARYHRWFARQGHDGVDQYVQWLDYLDHRRQRGKRDRVYVGG